MTEQPGLTPSPPSLEQLELLVRYARQRNRKADARIDAAAREKREAVEAMAAAVAARDHFVANDPERLP